MNSVVPQQSVQPSKQIFLNKIPDYVIFIMLTAFGVILFALSHPGVIFEKGVPFLAYIALVPVFFVSRHDSFKTVWLYGFAYGFLSYALYCQWLTSYELVVFFISCAVYAVIFAAVFTLLHATYLVCRKTAAITAPLVWCAYEYIKSLGYLGFSYGVIGYTQWQNQLLLQTSSLGGVWMISFLCALSSSCIESVANDFLCSSQKKSLLLLRAAFRKNAPWLIFTASLFCGSIIYGAVVLNKKSDTQTVKIVCVQNNADPWKNGVDSYRRDIHSLKTLTDISLANNDNVQFVVWPETAVVPSVLYTLAAKNSSERIQLVTELLSYFDEKDCAFVIGNEQSERTHTMYTDDYNAALVFDKQLHSIIPPEPTMYKKIHLVPFTEYFPYGKIFPRLYKKLLNGDTHLWTPGREYVVFSQRGVRFSTPICFEDTFGSLCRKFVNKKDGAQLFVNISNDAWSKSRACQYQHLSMAVFRAAENQIPLVRSTASGITCFIDRTGKVRSQVPQFTETALCDEVEVNSGVQKKTLYTTAGDWFAVFMLLCAAMLFCAETVRWVVERKRQNEVK